jgi:hypothetical protein
MCTCKFQILFDTFASFSKPVLRPLLARSTLDELQMATLLGVSPASNNWKAGARDRIEDSFHRRRRPLHLPISRLTPPQPYKNELIAAAGGQHTGSLPPFLHARLDTTISRPNHLPVSSQQSFVAFFTLIGQRFHL